MALFLKTEEAADRKERTARQGSGAHPQHAYARRRATASQAGGGTARTGRHPENQVLLESLDGLLRRLDKTWQNLAGRDFWGVFQDFSAFFWIFPCKIWPTLKECQNRNGL